VSKDNVDVDADSSGAYLGEEVDIPSVALFELSVSDVSASSGDEESVCCDDSGNPSPEIPEVVLVLDSSFSSAEEDGEIVKDIVDSVTVVIEE